MPELEIGLVDEGKLNFNQSFLKFNEKKKNTGNLTLNAEYSVHVFLQK